MHDIKVSNPKKILENILLGQRYNDILLFFIFMACFFFRKLFKKYSVCFILILHKFSFKIRGHMTIFWNLVPGVIFRVPQSGKIGDTGEFLLFWNGHLSFFGRVLGPLSEKPKMVSRYKFFYGTLLQNIAYFPKYSTTFSEREVQVLVTLAWNLWLIFIRLQ